MKWPKSIVFILLVAQLMACGTKRKNSEISTKKLLGAQYTLYKGTPYKYGGTTAKGFDCSGYVQKVYKNAFSTMLPRTTKEMGKLGKKIARSKLKVGDLVFFRPTSRYRHVGIYMGNNQFMHSSTSKGVILSSLDNVYWRKKYRYARRIITN